MSSTRFNPPVPTLEELNSDGTTRPDSDGIIEFEGNDLAGSTNRRTLRAYISSLTRGETPFVVSAPAQGVIEYNGPIPDHGNAYPLGDGFGSPDSTFTQLGIEGGGINVMQDYSDSGQFSVNDKTLLDIVKKGELGHAHGRETLSGHLLLQGVIGSANVDSPVEARTEGAKVLIDAIPRILDDNIYSPDSITGGSRSATALILTGSAGLLKVSRDREILSSGPNSESERVSVENLSKVAIDIMLRSSGKDKGPDQYPGFDAGLKSSNVQEGFSRVSTSDLAVGNYAGVKGLNSTIEGTGISFPDDDGVGTTAYSNTSHGSVYNPLESFSRLDSAISSYGVLALVAYGTVAVVGLVLSATSPSTKAPIGYRLKPDTEKYKKLEKGKFKFERDPNVFDIVAGAVGVSTDVTQLLNIYVPTNSLADYGQCVIIGFASLIGLTYNEDELNLLSDDLKGEKVFNRLGLLKLAVLTAVRLAAIAATGEKGYYLNLFREIVKDTGQIAGAIGADPQSLLTPSEGLGSILSSKIVRFVDTLARIGDLLLLQEHAKSLYRFNETQDADPYSSGFNPTDDTKKTSMKKFAAQRIRGAQFGSTRGSYLGTNQLPSAHLVPKEYVDSNAVTDARLTSYAGERLGTKSAGGGTNLRIDSERVAALEDVLDSEYMPFYFHDLRTNEIISFHAFLEDLSDSYQANYNSAGGYGRIEEIKTYKDTKRSVSVTFNVVATNPEDFDYMWWQINKLTTMVYPQWSRGRALKAKVDGQDFDFIQPFSQIPNATPVIRMRVGDLIRSNYSRFNLKRLFGYYDPKTNQENIPALATKSYYLRPGSYKVNGSDKIVDIEKEISLGPVKPINVNGKFIIFSAEAGATIEADSIDIKQSLNSTELAKKFYTAEGDDANSVIRAFETSMSKGLAGVVTQLQFTWMDQGILWGAGDDGPGNRAPRACKIQMSIDPIHDIAPGLDHEGFNRAPIYPVGKLVNSIVEGDEDRPYGVGSSRYFGK